MTAASPEASALHLPQAMYDEIVAHARAEAPRECCGLIGGPAGELRELYRLTNKAPGNDFYEMDDAELYRRYRDLDDRGWEIQVIYHSHPVSPAYPSKTDVALAAWPDAYYLICSLQQPATPVLRAFRIVDGTITECEIVPG